MHESLQFINTKLAFSFTKYIENFYDNIYFVKFGI